MKAKSQKPICEDCGAKDSVENPVWYDTNPYDEEINHDYTKHWLCAECRQEAQDEI